MDSMPKDCTGLRPVPLCLAGSGEGERRWGRTEVSSLVSVRLWDGVRTPPGHTYQAGDRAFCVPGGVTAPNASGARAVIRALATRSAAAA